LPVNCNPQEFQRATSMILAGVAGGGFGLTPPSQSLHQQTSAKPSHTAHGRFTTSTLFQELATISE
jgi:hypothetical protein